MAFTQDFRTQRRNYEDGDTRIGEKDRLWYDAITNTIRISDGETPGGIAVSGGSGGGSYTLPTATTSVKGGVKIDGTTITIDSGVISVGTVPYSSLSGAPTVPTNVSQLTNDTGFITGVSWTQVTGKPTLFSGAYADLTGKPTNVSTFTNDSGYLTSSSLSSYATQSYVTSRGYITSASLPTAVSDLTNDSGFLTEAEFDLNTINYDSNNNLHATGILPGDVDGFTAVFAGRAAGVAALPNTVIQSQAQVNDYAQNNFQNTSDGVHSSTEWVATSPNGSDTDYYIDMGINGASWDGTAENSLYANVGQRDGWLYVQGGNAGGGNLVLGTSTASTYTKIIAGDVSTGDREVARFSSTEVKLSKQLTFNDNTTQTTAWLGTYSYNDLTDTPTLVTSYNDLTDLPSLFSGAYADLSGKPTLVTSYNDLTDLPTLVTSYNDLTDLPSLFSGSYNDLTNKPTLTTSLSALTDVSTAGAITGQVLTYDSVTQRWIPGGAGGGATGALGYYGSFYDVTAQQTNAGASSANLVLLGGTYEANGISIQDGSKVTFSYAGTYSIVFSLQFVNDNAVEQDVSVWLKTTVGGTTTNVTDSTVVYTIDADTGSLGKLVAINPFILTVEAGEQIQIYWQSPSTDVYLKTIAAQTSPAVPRAPGVILTVEQTSSIVVPDSIAGNAATVTNGVYTTDTGTVTNTMLSGSIANNKLANSSLTVNGTSISLGSSGTVTANTTNALTIGRGLTGTASTFDGSAANTIALDTSVTSIVATAGATTTLSAATLTRYYQVTGSISGTHIFRLPDLTTLTAGQQITFFTSQATITFQLSTGTAILTNTVSTARQTTFTVVSNAANTTANLSYTQVVSGLVGTGTSLLTNIGPSINTAYITGLDSTSSTTAYASTPTLGIGPTSTAFNTTLNMYTAALVATWSKTINFGTGLNGGTSTINIGTGVTSGTATLNLGSATTTTTMNGAVTITSLTATNSIVGSITGNAATATKLGTARTINNVSFDGSASITVKADTNNALTIGSGLSGTSFDGSTAVTIAVDSTVALRADTHYIGTTSIALNRTSASQTLTGVSIDGNAATVTDGVYTSGTYADPSWLTSLAYSKLTGTPSLFSGSYTDLTNKPTIYSSSYIGTTSLDFTRASGSQTLTGVSIDGNAGTVTNGLYSTGSYANPAWITSLAYSKLTGAPTVPTNVSQLTNDSGYATLTGAETLTNKTLTLPTIGGTGATFNGSSSGTTVLKASSAAGTTTITLPARTGTVITSGDTGTVTNTMLEGNIANAKLFNSSVTIGSTVVALGTTAANLEGLNAVTATNFIGNASTATKLATARAINGTNFDGSAAITITAANPNALTIGTGLSGTSYTGGSAVTIAIDSTVATLTGSQTLTNKTLTLPTIGGTGATFNGSTSGTTVLKASAAAGTTTITMPATTGTVITTGDSGTVTNAMLAGSIANSKLANSSITINGSAISLGSSTTIASITASGFSSSLGFDGAGNLLLSNNSTIRHPTSLILQTGGPAPYYEWEFDNSGNLTFPDTTVQSTAWLGSTDTIIKVASSFGAEDPFKAEVVADTTYGVTIETWTGIPAFATSNSWEFGYDGGMTFPDSTVQTTAYTATAAKGLFSVTTNSASGNGSLSYSNGVFTFTPASVPTSVTINGTAVTLGSSGTVTAAAGTLTGTTLNSSVVTSSLTSVGTLTSLAVTNSSATPVTVTYTPATRVGVGILSTGKDTVGGTGYFDFFRATNTTSGVANGSKTMRLNNVGTLEILNSAYNATILSVTDAGFIAINTATSVTDGVPGTNAIAMNNNSYIYDDGNYHLTSKTGSVWINANDGSAVNVNTQMPSGITGGGMNVQGAVKSYGAGSTAFISSGSNVVSGVALQLDSGTAGTAAQMAIRDTSTVASTMYFDVSTGGTAHGSFQFRSSNAFTQLMSLSNSQVSINKQTLFGGGSFGAYVTITGTNSYNLGGPYGYLSSGGAGSVGSGGASGTVGWSLQCNGRIQTNEIDATSDERLKDIQGTIPLDRALQFVRAVDGILYTWKPGFGDEGLKSGFGAQSVHKAGFDHMVAPIPNDRVEGSTDSDGFTSPDKFQLTLNYMEAIPYHHEVIKHLLDRIEQLEATVAKLAK